MRLNNLRLRDKQLFDKYLSLAEHNLSVYAFANIYIWKRFFEIRWALIEKSLCVFFQDKIGSFLYLPALAEANNPQAALEAFAILDKLNRNPEFAHIENVEERDLEFYQGLGFRCALKSYDYLCERADLAKLQGDKFKSKRASCNYFIKHYDFEFKKLELSDRTGCLKLYNLWERGRKSGNADPIYKGMLEDSRLSLKEALANYEALGFQGRVVKINKEIKGFSFGFALNADVFCILYEITDLSIKGLAQFIFRSFSRELKNYKFINIMDDSGLENLKKVKLSYYPARLVPAYIVRRKALTENVPCQDFI